MSDEADGYDPPPAEPADPADHPSPSARLAAALDEVVAALPHGGEPRPGQRAMAARVESAIASGRHAVIQAGTGTGKSLAYLVPSILSGERVVIATATKALQDQLATKDLPFLVEHLGVPFEWAVVKGRANYLCRQRLTETSAASAARLELDGIGAPARAIIERLAEWAEETDTGDRADLDFEPGAAWAAVSVTGDECPGASKCPAGEQCFAEAARRKAADAQIVVANLALYGVHLGSEGAVLPEHDVVVIDEAHQLEDSISSTVGTEIGAGRFAALAGRVRGVLAEDKLTADLASAGSALALALRPHLDQRLPQPMPTPIVNALVAAGNRLAATLEVLTKVQVKLTDLDQRRARVVRAGTALAEELQIAAELPAGYVAWVEGDPGDPRLALAPVDVAPFLSATTWSQRTAILTSATVPHVLPRRVGLPVGHFDEADVGSPFDYAQQGLLYCALGLPEPRSEAFLPAMIDELGLLIEAAGGRTLALFTSWRALDAAVESLRPRLSVPVLSQRDLPTAKLIAAFAEDEATCLFATTGLFQGIDVPGRTLSLVTIDKLPFPRPDEPLLQARRDRAGQAAFATIDLPKAATLLAQAAGRLIRTADDSGVVACFDRRLGTARYRWDLIRALPPMARTKDRSQAEDFLRQIAASSSP